MRDNYEGRFGMEIREPKWTQQNYLVHSRLSKLLKENVAEYVQEQNEKILDLGCGNKPYQPFFQGRGIEYLGVDIVLTEFVDILCTGEKLPFKNGAFSTTLCAQVLEHVNEPTAVIQEISRVLKPGGLLFLSTHGSWPIHDSLHDYWRWTEHGLKKLLADFHIHKIHTCGGPAASIIQLLELYVPGKFLGLIIFFILNKLGDFLDSLAWVNAKLPALATNYFVVARNALVQRNPGIHANRKGKGKGNGQNE